MILPGSLSDPRCAGIVRAVVIAAALLLLPLRVLAAPPDIDIQVPAPLLAMPVARHAVEDSANLLKRMFPRSAVTINGPGAGVRLVLPGIHPNSPAAAVQSRPYCRIPVPDPSYHWRSSRQGATVVVSLSASSAEGVACGLYGLLQERLGMRFYHPRESIVPVRRAWPLPARFSLAGRPRFEKRGFHLHTLHPIELTEQLHNPAWPNAFEDVAAYIDWLARNGQNTFQFFLLREVDRDIWPAHARRIVEYAHSRGIRCGVEISLAMLQQQAFQAITLLRPWPSYSRQVDETLAWLFRAPWDFITLEATMGEYLPILGKFLPGVQAHLERQVTEQYGARLMYATHVITANEGNKVRRPLLASSGILIHTVMCWSASEQKAPVYGNSNQCFMLDAARSEKDRRETWYWPESSYWVGFDSSVPLLILPYLDSRWRDVETMARLGVDGHLTFTSGWEWGYWLVDWSIARWSWRLVDNGRERPTSPLSRLNELFPGPAAERLWNAALALQNRCLKERELLRYLSALTPFSELPHPFDKPFQPEPAFRYSWLLDGAGEKDAAALLAGPVTDLERYADGMTALVRELDKRIALVPPGSGEALLARELTRGLMVTALRARHRALTIRALLAKRGEHAGKASASRDSALLLEKARQVRQEAMRLVVRQEGIYRYPVARIARRHPSLTAYPFGYLYPVSNLFFWEREEEQVRHERFDALFMNLWDMRRTLGLESLLLK